MRLQALVDYFDVAVNQLVEAGYPVESIIDALKVVTTRAELLHGRSGGLKRLDAVANKLKAIADAPSAQPVLTPDANDPVIPDAADLLRGVANLMRENDK